MRLTAFLLVALSALAKAASSLENPITPIDGGGLVAGKPTTIKWTPTTTGPITLKLRSGPAENLDQGIVIACKLMQQQRRSNKTTVSYVLMLNSKYPKHRLLHMDTTRRSSLEIKLCDSNFE